MGLDEDAATDPSLVGGKAAALARVRRAGLHTLPGTVLTTVVSDRYDDGTAVSDLPGLGEAMRGASPPERPLVVRSSSVAEDQSDSSAAGQFESVVGVEGPEAFAEAVRTVLDSRERAGAGEHPIGILVQPMVDPDVAGVFFGVDPVTGRTDRRVVTAVSGQPDVLVSGEVDGSHYLLDDSGKELEHELRDGVEVPKSILRDLVSTGDRLEQIFGCPQDIEWAVVDGELTVLQSRPVTTEIRGVPSGPLYGPGPVAETFPLPLAPLEEDLWVPPLRNGVREALRLSGTVSEGDLQESGLVTVVDGRVALDLGITGEVEDAAPKQGLSGRIRRLRSAWRIGRLRTALPLIADELSDQVDADLEQVPPLHELTSRQLVGLMGRGRNGLESLHAHEILLGLLADPSSSRFTGASVAMRVLAEARNDGIDDAEIVRRFPVVLALVAPRIGPSIELPPDATAPDLAMSDEVELGAQARREALRLRVRWLQELVGQAAFELGSRLVDRGELHRADDVRMLRFAELSAVVARQACALSDGCRERAVADAEAEVTSLPARFRLGDRGRPIPVRSTGQSGGGTGAGGGTAVGVVTRDEQDPPEGSVLVVATLRPGLGPLLPKLSGIVSETGSVLSHLAILARESGVATVVGHQGALEELAEGATVSVDGQSGEVTVQDGDGTGSGQGSSNRTREEQS